MTTTTIAEQTLDMDALTLADFLQEHVIKDRSKTVVYVQDDEGRIFENVKLEKQTLTDGSEVYNIVLFGG